MEKDFINTHKYEGMLQKTDNLVITVSHLIIPMIWEGDLNIHSNVEIMKNSMFQGIILHGDTGLSIALQLIEQHLQKAPSYRTLTCKYKSSLTLNDELVVNYQISGNKLSFVLLKQQAIEVLQGELLGIEVGH